MPAWRAAIEPGSKDPKRAALTTFSADTLRQVPAYHLIGKKFAVEGATWTEKYGGDAYKWLGTLVYDGHVYDHIHYRARGGGWRYAMGKTMWKFAFNRGHDLAARDNYGRPYDTKWTRLNLGACIQQGNYGHRGEQGVFESAGFKLFNLASLEAPATHFVHFRVITDAVEADPANQFEGDFWGLYLAVEQPGGRFLDEHDLPDGNFYKMVGGSGELNNQGPRAASDKSDLNQFLRTYTGTRPADAWWRTNLDLPRYFNYRAVVEAIHHYDIDEGAGKNYFYYLNPQTAQWSVHPWDLDLTWADSMHGGGQDPFRDRVLPRPAFNREYQNRVRELRDLLLNDDEGWRVIDDLAAQINRGSPSFVDADRAKWDFHPALVKYSHSGNGGHGRFYQAAPTKDFAGMVRLMKDYLKRRGAWMDATLANDKAIPATPAVTAVGPPDFPRKHLQFRCAPTPAPTPSPRCNGVSAKSPPPPPTPRRNTKSPPCGNPRTSPPSPPTSPSARRRDRRPHLPPPRPLPRHHRPLEPLVSTRAIHGEEGEVRRSGAGVPSLITRPTGWEHLSLSQRSTHWAAGTHRRQKMPERSRAGLKTMNRKPPPGTTAAGWRTAAFGPDKTCLATQPPQHS